MTDLSDREEFFLTCQCCLVIRPEEQEAFRPLFEAFWFNRWGNSPSESRWNELHEWAGSGLTERRLSARAAETGEGTAAGTKLGSYSWVERLRHKDLSELTADEQVQLERFLAMFPLQLGQRRTRRFRPGRGSRLDLRATLRASLRYQGEWLRWEHRGRVQAPRPLVVLADISGSMERYSRVLLQFVYAAVRRHPTAAEAFVFGTRLTRITHWLRRRELAAALDGITSQVEDWSGGTRIGESLHEFNTTWARRLLGRGAVVLLISDGWDRGDPRRMASEVARLQRSAGRLIWLNPLLGTPGYRPRTRGLEAALPHVDAFMPANNLADLQDLAEVLRQLNSSADVTALQAPAMVQSRGGLA